VLGRGHAENGNRRSQSEFVRGYSRANAKGRLRQASDVAGRARG
jgi:hypothetical protein